MSRFLIIFILSIPLYAFAQQVNYNSAKGFAVQGYDVFAYFNGQPKKGSSNFTTIFDGVKYKFANQENLTAFNKAPEKYIPQYGGWCAYAMGTSGDKVSIDPETFEIRDGKLYLFYNAFFTNTFEKWKKEGPEKLRQVADGNWEKVKFKK